MSVILVHGLWHVPAHFDLLATALRERGIGVVVPELHRGSLATDAAAVQAVVEATAKVAGAPPVVVLGHSYGGSVITGLSGVAHLVYLAAFVPDAGESAASLGGPAPWADAAVVRCSDGTSEIAHGRAVEALYADCSPQVAARAVSLLRPQASGHGRGVPERAAWRSTSSTYVCAHDRVLDPDLQRLMAQRCTRSVEWSTSHSPFLGRPDLVAGLIKEVLEGPGLGAS